MKEVIDLAADSQFSQFSKKVKQSLEDKLKNHPTVKATTAQKDSYAKMRDQFAQITKPELDVEPDEEPKEVEDVEVDPVEPSEDSVSEPMEIPTEDPVSEPTSDDE